MMSTNRSGQPIFRSICHEPSMLIVSTAFVRSSTPCTYLDFALCTSPVPGELRISCRSCWAMLGNRIDSRVRRSYQRGVENADSAGCARVFSRLYREEIFHGGYRRCFVTFHFVDVDNGCVVELLRNSPAVPDIVE